MSRSQVRGVQQLTVSKEMIVLSLAVLRTTSSKRGMLPPARPVLPPCRHTGLFRWHPLTTVSLHHTAAWLRICVYRGWTICMGCCLTLIL